VKEILRVDLEPLKSLDSIGISKVQNFLQAKDFFRLIFWPICRQ